MITNAILNFVYGVFGFIFDLLPIPSIPSWYYDYIVGFTNTWIARGCNLFTWLFPAGVYSVFIDTVITLFLVNVMYDVLKHFHFFK